MREWYAASELVGMLGLPAQAWSIRRVAAREAWRTCERHGNGGVRLEYHLSSLPESTRQRLAALETARLTAAAMGAGAEIKRGELWRRQERATVMQRAEAGRRLGIVARLRALEGAGASRADALAAIASESAISRATIYRWLSLTAGVARADWLAALTPVRAARGRSARCPAEAWALIKADYLRAERPSFLCCFRRLARIAEARGWTLPSARALERRLEREVPREVRLLAREGPEQMAIRFPAQERDRSVFHACEAVTADGHRFDVFVRWPDGETGRPHLIAWQDLYSGKILSWRLTRSENKDDVRLSFGALVERWGIPEHAYLDNGRAFTSKWMSGRMKHRYRFKIKEDEPEGIFLQLGVQVHWTTPYHGQSKPIERAFGELTDEIARHPALAGAYVGRSPGHKPSNYGSRVVPFAEFERVVESELAQHNARRGRSTPTAHGRSLDETFEASYEEAPIRQATRAQRALWLLAAEGVTVRRRTCSIHLDGNRYWTEELVALEGRKVVIRFDPAELHAGVHVYQLDGTYVCHAPVVMAVGFNDQEAAKAHAKARHRYMRNQREELELHRTLQASDVAAALAGAPADEAPRPAAKVIRLTFAKPHEEPEGQRLDAAEDAAFWRQIRASSERRLADMNVP